jgi:UDP-N-acetylmuramate--alanine ligase
MKLFDPSNSRPIHFMGIGGAGMSALALLACRRGVAVTGCDPDPSGADDVAALGVVIERGHDPAHLAGARAVVATAAIPTDHPELKRAAELGLPVVPRKRALAEFVAGGQVIGVAGTHGKSTTTVMATEALAAAGFAPTGIAGGRVASWGGNARVGGDRWFVVESDEYDQAFLELSPAIAVINNVEADHLECYGSLAALEAAFVSFAAPARRVLLGADDPGCARVAAQLSNPIWRFGTGEADLRITQVVQTPEGSRARVSLPGSGDVELRLRVPGLHNLRNATAALGTVLAVGGQIEPALAALEEFRGVGRRFERLGEVEGVALVDDYAHHPTELVATIAAARQAFPGRRLVAVFQPHLYSRTAAHWEAMGRSLAAADLVIVTEIYAAREQPLPGVSGRQVADAAQAAGAPTIFVPRRPELAQRVYDALRAGDVVLTLGAGDITHVGPELARCLRAA